MMPRVLVVTVLGLVIGAGLPYAVQGPAHAVRNLTLTVASAPGAQADTLVVAVTWQNPPGGSPVDSLKVNVSNITAGAWFSALLSIVSTQHMVRQPIPLQDAGYTVQAQVCRYRGSKAACVAAEAPFAYTLAAPDPVVRLGVTVTKVP